jgi:excisionase family DNA binding protein
VWEYTIVDREPIREERINVMREREWLTVREAAKKMGLSAPRVYQLIDEGEVPGVYRTGKRSLRIDQDEFTHWLESRRLRPF